jgi:hypothetical protein
MEEDAAMRRAATCLLVLAALTTPRAAPAGPVTTGGQAAQLDIRVAGERSLRITLKPLSFTPDFPVNPALAGRAYPAPALSLREITTTVRSRVGTLHVEVRPDPLTIAITTARGEPVQEIVFEPDGRVSFRLDDEPVVGLGGGGPRPDEGTPWREQPVQFDRRGRLDTMLPRWQSDMYGSRNPVAMLFGTKGWGLFLAAPWAEVDLRELSRGVFLPWTPTDEERVPQAQRNQHQPLAKGRPPASAVVPGLVDLFVFDASDPAAAMNDVATITGRAAMPPGGRSATCSRIAR